MKNFFTIYLSVIFSPYADLTKSAILLMSNNLTSLGVRANLINLVDYPYLLPRNI